jgi:hypothetical protein
MKCVSPPNARVIGRPVGWPAVAPGAADVRLGAALAAPLVVGVVDGERRCGAACDA